MQKPPTRLSLLLLLLSLFPWPARGEAVTDFNLSAGYAQTVWPAGHRDSSNTDYVPVVMSRSNRISKQQQ